MKGLVFVLAMTLCLAGGCFTHHSRAASGGEKHMSLPKPVTTGGKALMDALSQRKSERSFSGNPVSDQDLSNILWAAWGVNRADGKRTVPTSRNRQEMQVFAVLESGVWQYDPAANTLSLALAGDQRGKYGGAPLVLLYSAPFEAAYGGMHAGSAYQNVGLYCASAGLANVVKTTGVDALKDSLPLPSGYKVLVIQAIGWPK